MFTAFQLKFILLRVNYYALIKLFMADPQLRLVLPYTGL